VEAERTRADAETIEQESRIRAARSMYEARQETYRAEKELGALRATVLETFRDIRDRTVTALGEVEAVIEREGAASDAVVIVEDADELASADGPPVPRPDL
jgi:hypothetical protein